MEKLKFLISHPGYIFYYIVMGLTITAVIKNPSIIIDAPLGIQIGVIFTIVVGTGAMIYHMIDAWKISKTEQK